MGDMAKKVRRVARNALKMTLKKSISRLPKVARAQDTHITMPQRCGTENPVNPANAIWRNSREGDTDQTTAEGEIPDSVHKQRR